MSEEAKVDLQTQAAQVKLERLQRNLENLQKRPVTPKIEIAIGRTVAQIERVEAQLDKLDRRRVDIDVDVDRRGVGRAGGIGGAAVAGVGAIAGGIAAATRGSGCSCPPRAGGSRSSAGSWQLFTQLGISGAALGPIFLILVPIIGICRSSERRGDARRSRYSRSAPVFLTAAAGVGVLGVALAGAFGPVVLVAIAAMARFAKILQAVKAAEDGTATGARNASTALQAQATAAEAVDDAIRGIAQAELSREQASLGVEQAELALKRVPPGSRASLRIRSTACSRSSRTSTSGPQGLIDAIRSPRSASRPGGDQLQLQQLILNVRRPV